MTDFDLLVLGGGSAGFAAAIRAADIGARVAIVEGGTLGGTCVNVGCIPSKTLLRAAAANHLRTRHGFDGIPDADGRPRWSEVKRQKDDLVATLRREKYVDVLDAYPTVTLVRQRAELAGEQSVRLADGTTVRAGRIVVATGASPSAPAIDGLADTPYLDSTRAMALEQLPESLAVIGAGAVGLELGQMFARLGVRVTILEAMPHILPAEDAALGDALAAYLREEGMDVLTGVRIDRVSANGNARVVEFRSGGAARSVSVAEVLVATGRHPNTASLGLDRAGVRLDDKGRIEVNEFLQTSRPTIYAAGDVIGDPMFVYVAAYGGSLAAENALRGNARTYDLSVVPSVTFTDPAVASIGLTAAAARQRDIEPLVTRLGLEHVPRARAARDVRGFIQLVADASSRRIIGAQALASEAGELLGEAALAIRGGVTIEQLAGALHPYLTLAEGLKLAAQTFTSDVAKLSCCAA